MEIGRIESTPAGIDWTSLNDGWRIQPRESQTGLDAEPVLPAAQDLSSPLLGHMRDYIL